MQQENYSWPSCLHAYKDIFLKFVMSVFLLSTDNIIACFARVAGT